MRNHENFFFYPSPSLYNTFLSRKKSKHNEESAEEIRKKNESKPNHFGGIYSGKRCLNISQIIVVISRRRTVFPRFSLYISFSLRLFLDACATIFTRFSYFTFRRRYIIVFISYHRTYTRRSLVSENISDLYV